MYFARRIEPDEAVAIERALAAEGVTIVDVELEADTDTLAEALGSPADPIGALLRDARKYPLLTAAEEAECGAAVVRAEALLQGDGAEIAGDGELRARVIDRAEQAKTRLVVSNVRLAVKVAHMRPFRDRLPPEDLVQEGIIGLMTAARKYDPAWGTRFSTYAMWWVRQAMWRAIDDQGSTIRIPVHMRDRIRRYNRALARQRANGASTSVAAIADVLGWDTAYTGRVAALAEMRTMSLDAPVGDEDGDATLGDLIASDALGPDRIVERSNTAHAVGELIAGLSERLRDIIKRRFGVGLGDVGETLEEIGMSYGVTRERIRQLESKALDILRRHAIKVRLRP